MKKIASIAATVIVAALAIASVAIAIDGIEPELKTYTGKSSITYTNGITPMAVLAVRVVSSSTITGALLPVRIRRREAVVDADGLVATAASPPLGAAASAAPGLVKSNRLPTNTAGATARPAVSLALCSKSSASSLATCTPSKPAPCWSPCQTRSGAPAVRALTRRPHRKALAGTASASKKASNSRSLISWRYSSSRAMRRGVCVCAAAQAQRPNCCGCCA